MKHTCVHHERQEFNADCIFCRERQQNEDLFEECISSYTDSEAVEDGFLVAFRGPGDINRVTRAVFDHFTQSMGMGVTNITPLTQAMEYMLTVEPDDRWRTGNYRGKALWLIPNEVGGLTLMFPEDC